MPSPPPRRGRCRDEDLASRPDRYDPRAGIHDEAADLTAHDFGLAEVHAGPDLEPKMADALCDLVGASDRLGGARKTRDETVAGRVELPPVLPLQRLAIVGRRGRATACRPTSPAISMDDTMSVNNTVTSSVVTADRGMRVAVSLIAVPRTTPHPLDHRRFFPRSVGERDATA